MIVQTNLHPRDYLPNEVCRIVNPKQYKLYIKNGLYPIDIYTSVDEETGNDIIVMIFDRIASYPLYQAWCDHTLK